MDYDLISKMSLEEEIKNFLSLNVNGRKNELVARVTASENGVKGVAKL